MQSRQIGLLQTTQFAAAADWGCLPHGSHVPALASDTACEICCAGAPMRIAPEVVWAGATAIGAGLVGGAAASWLAITSFAASVPSAPHTGHATGAGIRSLIGSISKANFDPQEHRTLIVMETWGVRDQP